jgi:LPPG:FO 2-phospho-L-lactate transferase
MPRILAITGGVGGAKLALGLAQLLGPEELTFAVNAGDDFTHLGLEISPDLDTLTYTLADLANPETGWGRRDESWQFMAALREMGGETWFQLGDRDLALHIRRTELLRQGASRTEAAAIIGQALRVAFPLLPMSDDPVRTTVHTNQGALAFQHYFVRERCQPEVISFEFQGLAAARANPAILSCLDSVDGIVICPSNPYVSVDPMLHLPGMRDALMEASAPVVAVSPIVGGTAIKGPTAKMMRELAIPNTASAVAAHYGDLLDGFILDEQDRELKDALGLPAVVTQTVMITLQDRVDLARNVLAFIQTLT